MYSSVIASRVRQKITRYGDLYLEWFISRFSDTGLGYAETIICNQYLESSDLLVESIYRTIEKATAQELLPYSPLPNGIRETSIRLGARRLFIQYEEDQENIIRYITDIEILRK